MIYCKPVTRKRDFFQAGLLPEMQLAGMPFAYTQSINPVAQVFKSEVYGGRFVTAIKVDEKLTTTVRVVDLACPVPFAPKFALGTYSLAVRTAEELQFAVFQGLAKAALERGLVIAPAYSFTLATK